MSSLQQKIDLARVVSYTPPRLYVGKEWYVGWYSFCPIEQKLKRKKVKLNHITNKNERRKYANDLIVRVNEQLRKGWNPFKVLFGNILRYHC